MSHQVSFAGVSVTRRFRLAYRAPAALATSVALFLLTLVGNALFFRSSAFHLRRRWQRAVYRSWARWICRILGVRVRVEGPVPDSPCLLVTNHLSYVDVVVIASVLPARFVAKAEIGGWPLIGAMCRAVDTLFVDRSRRRDAVRVAAEIAEGLKAGDAIVLFPEGTSGAGYEVMPFRAPLLEPVVVEQLPVHYGALHYATAIGDTPAYLGVCWWADMPFGAHALKLLQLGRVDATLRFGPEVISGAERKQLAERLHAEVRSVFRPVVDFEPTSPPDYP